MSDPRRRVGPGCDPVGDRPAEAASPMAPERPGDWPRHPWVGVVERFAPDPELRTSGEGWQVTIVWWETRAGRQPVLLARRIRYD